MKSKNSNLYFCPSCNKYEKFDEYAPRTLSGDNCGFIWSENYLIKATEQHKETGEDL